MKEKISMIARRFIVYIIAVLFFVAFFCIGAVWLVKSGLGIDIYIIAKMMLCVLIIALVIATLTVFLLFCLAAKKTLEDILALSNSI